MHINFVRLNLADVFLRPFCAEKLADFAAHLRTVHLHQKIFHQFVFHGGDVFMRYIRIGVHFRAVGRVAGGDIVVHKAQLAIELLGVQPNHKVSP